MSVTVAKSTAIVQGKNTESYTIIATADGDIDAAIAHTLGVTPKELEISIEPTDPVARISLWTLKAAELASASTTTINLQKATTAGSGAAAIQAVVHLRFRHSLAR
jgi:hypothetical protein